MTNPGRSAASAAVGHPARPAWAAVLCAGAMFSLGAFAEEPDAALLKKDAHSLAVSGRALVRWGYLASAGRFPESALSVDTARAQLEYRFVKRLRVVLELELFDRPKVKDAYLKLRMGDFAVRAGNLRPPGSVFELSPRLRHPTADRGLLHEVFEDALLVGGRRPGVQLEWEGGGWLDPEVLFCVFQGSDASGDLLPPAVGAAGLGAGARAQVKLARVRVGAFAELRAVQPVLGLSVQRLFSGGLDAHWELRRPSGALRLWTDVALGQSQVDHDVFDGAAAFFLSGRLQAAWRWGGLEKEAPYLEPYLFAGVFEPDARIREDLLLELTGGLNAGLWRRARLTLQVQTQLPSRNTPDALDVVAGRWARRLAVVAQLGAEF